jgi:ATP-dependent Clp protease protease subunit
MLGLHTPSRRIYLKSSEDNELDHETAAQCIKNLHILEALNSDPIEIWINTPGGDEVSGYAIYDVVSKSQCRIIGVAVGECSSAGTLVLQACDVRTAYPSTYFLYHDGSISVSGSMRDVEAQTDANRSSRLRYYQILSDRTGKPASYWNRKLAKDLCLTAEQALQEHLIDEIIK